MFSKGGFYNDRVSTQIVNDPLSKIKAVLSTHERLIVWSPGSPDPDFLAGAEVLRQMGRLHNCHIDILGAKPLSLEVNRRLVHDFSIPYRVIRQRDLEGVSGIIVIDYAKATPPAMAVDLPVLLHIDHHQAFIEDKGAENRILDLEVGAVSTLIADWLLQCQEKWCQYILESCATILYYAIQVDTDALLHASPRDRTISDHLRSMVNESWLKKNLKIRLNVFQRERVEWGLERAVNHEGTLLCGLGLLSATERDLIAITSDFLVKRKGIELTAVFALIHTKEHLTLDVSLRSKSKRIDLYDLIQKITDEGGARPFKGAYQINMDYFLPLLESDLLWQIIEESTRFHIISALKPELKQKIWSPISSWLKNLGRFFSPD